LNGFSDSAVAAVPWWLLLTSHLLLFLLLR
jgi:hypothetical protein